MKGANDKNEEKEKEEKTTAMTVQGRAFGKSKGMD